jgi:hypothetical protein
MINRESTRKLLKAGAIALGLTLVVGYTIFATRDYIRGPLIIISEPVNGSTSLVPDVLIKGQALRIKDLTFNGRPLLIDKEGNFSETILLLPGYNAALFVAHDKFGRSAEYRLELVYEK